VRDVAVVAGPMRASETLKSWFVPMSCAGLANSTSWSRPATHAPPSAATRALVGTLSTTGAEGGACAEAVVSPRVHKDQTQAITASVVNDRFISLQIRIVGSRWIIDA